MMISEPMKLAIQEARKTMNADKGGPFGAAIIGPDGKLVCAVSNLVLETCDPTAHAEVVAIRTAGRILGTHDLTGCTLYATGYPCPMCMAATIWANIKTVYYGTDLLEAEEIGFRDRYAYDWLADMSKSDITITQTGHEACLELFREYRDKGKVIY